VGAAKAAPSGVDRFAADAGRNGCGQIGAFVRGNKKGGSQANRPYHHEYINPGFTVPRQVVPEGVVETGCRPFFFLMLLKGDYFQAKKFSKYLMNVNLPAGCGR